MNNNFFENVLLDSPQNSNWIVIGKTISKKLKEKLESKNISLNADVNPFFVFLGSEIDSNEIIKYKNNLNNYGILSGKLENISQEELYNIFSNNYSVLGDIWIYVKIELDNSKIPIITATIGKNPDALNRCIHHINLYTSNFIHYIIDNSQNEETSLKIRNLCDGQSHIYIKHSANQLGAINRNLVIKNSKHKYCAIVDDDVYICQNWLEKGKKAIDVYNASFVYVMSKNFDTLFHYDILFDGFNLFSLDYGKKIGEVQLLDKKIKPCAVLPTACCVMRTEDIQKVGCFSDEYAPVLFEDFDLCLKLHEAGYTLFSIGSIQCEHDFGTTTGHMTEYMKINGVKFKNRWRHRYENYGFAKYILNKSASHYEIVGIEEDKC